MPSRLDPSLCEGPNLRLRLITPDDAAYVFKTRTDPAYNAHLSQVTGTVEDQAAWIRSYKDREAAGSEYYFAIERKSDNLVCGLIRIYDIEDNQFTWGSFVLDKNKPPKAAVESMFLTYQVGFRAIGCHRALFEAHRENTHALALYDRFGGRRIGEDDTNVYFEYALSDFEKDAKGYLGLLENAA